ncbi:helix-turn-helix transcriptional regulator [Saccharopolyspora erythraea]|nr:helix-turn-helix transcriptional regulator [Saccharopolyspora erythraea]
MPDRPTLFGAELRRLRIAAGMALSELARRVHYSKGYLSKVETGLKPAQPDLARRCDAALDAGGALAALVPAPASGVRLPETGDDGEVWMLNLSDDGLSRFQPMDRRQALAAGAASVLGFGLGGRGMAATAAQSAPLETFRELFGQLRRLGQTASPGVVLPTLIAQTHTLRGLSSNAGSRTRGPLLALTARYAEYAGWMAQESGDDRAALWWTDRAVELAAAGDDHDLATYSLVRRALVTLYREDAAQTVELARQAQNTTAPPRIHGLAAQREAQGHALAGDYDRCLRSLDRARELLARDARESEAPVLGTVNLTDPVAMMTGWCLHDLGRSREAAEIMDREISRLPAHALRSHARYGVRRALSHAAAGEIDHACELTAHLLGSVEVVGSATVLTDLRRLARTLARFRTHPAVRELYPRLTAALHDPTAPTA